MDWPELLDEMEQRLVASRRTLFEGAEPPPSFASPAGMGPLPDELRERATRVLIETSRLASSVRAARDQLASARRRSCASRRVFSAYVDTRT